MKKLSILLSLLLLFGCSDRDSNEVAKQNNFYLSDNETSSACAFVFYDVEGAPKLTIENRIVNYHFNEENILTTSSSVDFGWASEEESGFRNLNFYNSDGSKITSEDEKPPLSTGGIAIDGIEHDYTVIHLKDQEECFSSNPTEDNSLFTDLVRKVYH